MSQINKPTDYFNTVLYTGDGTSSNAITGVGFQPDWVWIKERSSTSNHQVGDAVRGATKIIETNTTNSEATDSARFISFDSDGFTQGANNGVNESGQTYASWNWLADNTSGSSNTDGSITSTVSANTTSGFSIVSYTGNGTAGATIGHDLGAVPKNILVKSLGSNDSWRLYHASIGATKFLSLNSTNAAGTNSAEWNNTAPTSSVFSVGSGTNTNTNGQNYIAYCFAEKKGFSKFGSYTGNGSADGTFIYTGFKPAFVIRKSSTYTGTDWRMDDNKRPSYNTIPYTLFPNNSGAEATSSGYYVDLLSNGFKCRGTSANQNTSGETYIYMAFASEPLVGSNNVPATAR